MVENRDAAPPVAARGQIEGIDYLRAFFSVCVVVVHMGYVSPSRVFVPESFSSSVFGWSDFINFYVLTLAVPVFYLVSCYLLAIKPVGQEGLIGRLTRIARMLIFWPLALNVCAKGLAVSIKDLLHYEHEYGPFVVFLTGWKTYYYFFSSLLVLQLATYWAKRLPVAVNVVGFLATTGLLAALPVIAVSTGRPFLAHHANPLNFLPLSFAAILIRTWADHRETRGRGRIAAGLFLGAALLGCLDWTLYKDALFFRSNLLFALPTYTRPSLILLSMGVLILAFRVHSRPGRVIAFMSTQSLALYCIHPFLLGPIEQVTRRLHLANGWEQSVRLVASVVASYLVALVLPAFFRKDLMR